MKNIHYTQNYLRDENLVRMLVQKAEISSGDIVVEVGPGKGIITRHLAEKVGGNGKVIAIEVDSGLVANLRKDFQSFFQVEIIDDDARNYQWGNLVSYKVFSNIPFMFTSDIMSQLLDVKVGPNCGYIILQKEAASLYLGSQVKNGTPTLKSLLLYPFYSCSILYKFSRNDFLPQPRVDTVLFSFTKRENPLISNDSIELYEDFMTYISGDRVGEGVWGKIFSKQLLTRFASDNLLVVGKGLKAQTSQGLLHTFTHFAEKQSDKHSLVKGAKKRLEKQQLSLSKKHRTRNDSHWKDKQI
jgi:23S rRNA (adenine-N6)-dimethyltransferase